MYDSLRQVVSGIQDQEFTVTDVVEGKEYLFKVSACNKCGPGEPAYIDEPVNVSSPASELQHLLKMVLFVHNSFRTICVRRQFYI